MGAAALPIILAASSAGVSYYNGQQVAKKQDSILGQSIRNKDRHQADADAKVRQTVEDTAASNPAGDINASMARYRQALGANQGLTNSSFGGTTGGAQFQQDSNNAALGVQDYGKMLSGLFSRVDAAGSQRRREGNMRADTGVDIDLIKRFTEGDDFISKLKLNGVRRNPWLDALSSGLSGAASGMAGTGGGSWGDLSSSFANDTGIYAGMT